jgi:AmmeMemoRadiSam system protein A
MNDSAPADTSAPTTEQGSTLLALARSAIARKLGATPPLVPVHDSGWLQQPGASFVTLTRDGKLRGCIGSLEAHRQLGDDVTSNAVSAAIRDRRFKPLPKEELPLIRVEVSLLSPVETLPAASEAETLTQLRPGIDGVIFRYGRHRSTFLPQVWAQFPQATDFMAHLKHKAGLPPDFWDAAVSIGRYQVTAWHEPA